MTQRHHLLVTAIIFLGLALPGFLRANTIPVGQLSILPASETSTGYYGFTIANLTGSSYGCNAGDPVCTALDFLNPTLTVNYGYADVTLDPNTGAGVVSPGTLTGQNSFTATAQASDAFNPAYNYCGVYGVDPFCAGTNDVANAFQLPLSLTDGSGKNLVLLSVSFSATVAPTTTNLGVLSGTVSTSLHPTTDCGGPCNFFDYAPGLYTGDPWANDWEYYDAGNGTLLLQPPVAAPVPEPATFWLLLPGIAWLGWRRWSERDAEPVRR